MANKIKAKIYMVGSTAGVEVDIKDKDKFLDELKKLSSENDFYIHTDEDGEIAINTSLIQAIEFSDEKDGKKIARKIVLERKKNKIDTQKLVQIINLCKRNNNKKIHNSTKIFQALRIFVNKEISELIKGLINSVNILEKNGILILVSFHSLEDKIIKTFFKLLSENKKISRYLPENIKKKIF